MLRIGQKRLAELACVSVITIRRIEAMDRIETVAPATLDGVRRQLEQAGAEFIVDGVRRRRPQQADGILLAGL